MRNQRIKLGVIGFGNMAEAILSGILKNKIIKPTDIFATEPDYERARDLKRKYKTRFCRDIAALSKKTTVILISVKPQQIHEVLTALAPCYSQHLLLTIVAGVRTNFYERKLGKKIRLIRIMPNSPIRIGCGATAFKMNKNANARDKKIFLNLFSPLSHVVEVRTENLLDAVTALSASGPAFVYHFIHGLILAGKKAGLSAQTAKALVLQTVAGSARLVQESGEEPVSLAKKVTSKGGTTLAGLKVLQKKQFARILGDCIKAAARRARDLSNLFGR